MGLGYIGLPTAIIAAKHGVDIVGVDINPSVVEQTNAGHLHIIEPGMEEMLQTSAPVLPEPVSAEPPAAIPEPQPEPVEKEPVSVKGPEAEPVSDRTGEVLTMYRDGMSEVEIAKKMNMGVGEVRLVIGLYRGEKDS